LEKMTTRNKRIHLFVLIFILTAAAVSAQVKTGGYFACDYARGQSESIFSRDTFLNPLMGIVFSGQASRKINFVSEATLTQGNVVDITQAWAGMALADYINIKLGLFIVPFGQYNENNLPHQSMLINTPLNVEYLFPFRWRDVGAVAEGMFSGIMYSLYIGNGLAENDYLNAGQQFKDNNKDKAWGGRFGLRLDQGFDAYYSIYRGKYDDANTRNLGLQALNFSWKTEELEFSYEYTKANIGNPDGFSNGNADGYYIQFSFYFSGIQPVASYQRYKYNDDFHGPGFNGSLQPGTGIAWEKSRWSLGAVLRLSNNALLKVEYDFNREKDIELKNNVLFCQLAVSF